MFNLEWFTFIENISDFEKVEPAHFFNVSRVISTLDIENKNDMLKKAGIC